jgi:hypothetical protein
MRRGQTTRCQNRAKSNQEVREEEDADFSLYSKMELKTDGRKSTQKIVPGSGNDGTEFEKD